ncbi:hypothetical protein Moror_4094 [Moniliophthora roreri MCA 2997]|uniref:Uncharacterized protein n=2 Tax=Moniliophthora roreri TaxID=221103 RepID=V2XD40_MONRO|nr:hypothetical protein Moror_4094 [Moniliophthora roreri MCA 2997]KAI3600411.1 hypothetical protein WG66_001701 [Moniliophthora roreri]
MFSKLHILVVASAALAGIANAQVSGCGGGGSFTVSDIRADLPGETLNARSQIIVQQGSGQICIVNRAPNTIVTITAQQVNDAINNVLSSCCGGNAQTCAGGQDKITADTGNVIDLSVQGLGQDCTP